MNPDGTETSSEAPESYGGFLAESVDTDEGGNVVSVKPSAAAKDAARAEPPRYEEDYFRREAIHLLRELLPYVPAEMRSTNVAGLLREADDIAKWLRGEPIE